MSLNQLTIWFIDELAAPELERALVRTLGMPEEWAMWELFDDVRAAQLDLEAVEHATDFPDAVLVRAVEVEAAGLLVSTLRSRCKPFGKTESAYQLIANDGESLSDPVSVATFLRRAEQASSEAARHRLASGGVVSTAGTSALLSNCVQSIDNALETWHAAEVRFATEVCPVLQRFADDVHERARASDDTLYRELLVANTPILAEIALQSCRGALACEAAERLSDVIGQANEWWSHAEHTLRQAVTNVWRELDREAFYSVAQLVPFAGRRLWLDRNSAAAAEQTLGDLNAIWCLLEEGIDHTWTLTRLLRSIDVNKRRMPVTVFAHMLHSWSRSSDFEMHFGFRLPEDHHERERLLRAELYGVERSEIPTIKRISLPEQTTRHIQEDIRDRKGGGFGEERLLDFLSDEPLADWCVVPRAYLEKKWTDIVTCQVEVVRDAKTVDTEEVLMDWRLLHDSVKSVVAEVKGTVHAVKVSYSPDGKHVTLDFDITVSKHRGIPAVNAGKGSGKQALRDLVGWCQSRIYTNDGSGRCYQAVGPTFLPNEIESRGSAPFVKLSLSIPHYNHTREAS